MVRTLIRTFLGGAFLAFATAGWASCDSEGACRNCGQSSNPESASKTQELPAKLERFYSLNEDLDRAYKSGDLDAVKKLAAEYLELAPLYKCDWNYGNAIHDGNRMLGLAALKQGDLDAAANYLREAGRTSGSPQLDTFGPELDLADALLKAGRTQDVKEYLADIHTFWTMDDGRLDKWQAAIDRGERPELERFDRQPQTAAEIAFGAVYLAWPVIITVAFAYLMRHRLVRKRRYMFISIVTGYVTMFGTAALFGLVFQAFLLLMAGFLEDLSDNATIFIVEFLPIIFFCSIPVLTSYLIARRFLSKLNAPTALTSSHGPGA